MMKPAHRVVMNTGILYARMAITVFLSLYTTRVTLSALGVGDFGIFNVVGGAIAMLTFLNASMAAATQRFMSFAQGQGDQGRQLSIFNVSLVLHAVIALLLLLLLEVAGYVLFNGVLKIEPDRMHAAWVVYQVSIISTLFTIIGVPYDAVVNARENMLFFSVLGVIESVLKLVIALLIVGMTGDRLVMYGSLTALTTVLLFVLRAVYCHARYAECVFALRRRFDKTLLREMSAYAGWSFLGSSTSMVANYGQGIVMNMFFGATLNAAQGVSGQVSGQLSAFATVMMKALNPLIAKSEGSGDRQLMIRATQYGSKGGFFILLACYAPVLIDTTHILGLWLTEVPEYAVSFCQIILVRNLIEQIFIPIVSAIHAVGNVKRYHLLSSAMTVVVLPVVYVFFKLGFGPESMYWIFVVYSVLMSAVILVLANKLCGISISEFLINVVMRCGFVTLLVFSTGIIVFNYFELSHFRLLFTVVFSFGFSAVFVWGFGLDRDERVAVYALLRSIVFNARRYLSLVGSK